MVRDWKRIRNVLEDIEGDRLAKRLTALPKGDEETERYLGHLWLLIDQGFVEGVSRSTSMDGEWLYGLTKPRLTFSGHNLLDAIRSETIWNEVKRQAQQLMVPVSLELIKSVVAKVVG